MMKKKIIYILTVILVGLWSCESLEDTYSDFAGDGLIRYVGVCTELEATPLWEAVELTWKNAEEPGIDSIKIVWTGNGITKDTLLPKGTTSCVIEHLEDYTYTFNVYAMDVYKNLSLDVVVYGRPYTSTHEAISVLSTVVIKQIPFGEDNLLIYLDTLHTNIDEAVIHYVQKSTGEEIPLVLYSNDDGINLLKDPYYLLEDVDYTKNATLSRRGKIDEKLDIILELPELEIDLDETLFNNDFLAYICETLDVSELTTEMRYDIEELCFDYSLSSLEDILYFPNLKRIKIGSQRYLPQDAYIDDWENPLANLYDQETSLYVLELAHDLLGVEIIEYKDLYFKQAVPFIEDIQKYAVLPDFTYLPKEDWIVNISPVDDSGYPSHPEYLYDDDPDTYWSPRKLTTQREHEIEIDLKEEKPIKGFTIQQIEWMTQEELLFMPTTITIEVSSNRVTWTHVKNQQNLRLGAQDRETTLILLSQVINARYVRLSFYDGAYYELYGSNLAEISIITE